MLKLTPEQRCLAARLIPPPVRRGIRFLQLALRTGSFSLAAAMRRAGLGHIAGRRDRRTGGFVLASMPVRLSLCGGLLVAETRDIRVALETLGDLSLVEEVLCDGEYEALYQYRPPTPVIVWDIGMNIGAVSLLFATRPDVAAVYAYEPFPHTYECALKTLSLNPALREKIHTFNTAVGGRDASVTSDYVAEFKASVSVGRLPAGHIAEFHLSESSIQSVELRVAEAAPILTAMQAAHSEASLIAKVDCEGSEYEIFGSLEKRGLIRALSAISVECHGGRGPEMERLLQRHGFATTLRTRAPGKLHMIEAVRLPVGGAVAPPEPTQAATIPGSE